MANATVNKRVTKTEVVEVSPASVTLTLTPVEAAAVFAVLGHLTGRGVRDITSPVWYSMRVCFKDYWTPCCFDTDDGNASFLPESDEEIIEWAKENFVG